MSKRFDRCQFANFLKDLLQKYAFLISDFGSLMLVFVCKTRGALKRAGLCQTGLVGNKKFKDSRILNKNGKRYLLAYETEK